MNAMGNRMADHQDSTYPVCSRAAPGIRAITAIGRKVMADVRTHVFVINAKRTAFSLELRIDPGFFKETPD
jgi:hypothetical protein